jgi:hypothetical protein
MLNPRVLWECSWKLVPQKSMKRRKGTRSVGRNPSDIRVSYPNLPSHFRNVTNYMAVDLFVLLKVRRHGLEASW